MLWVSYEAHILISVWGLAWIQHILHTSYSNFSMMYSSTPDYSLCFAQAWSLCSRLHFPERPLRRAVMLRESLQLERVESVLATSHVLHRVLTPATLTGGDGGDESKWNWTTTTTTTTKKKGPCLETMSKEKTQDNQEAQTYDRMEFRTMGLWVGSEKWGARRELRMGLKKASRTCRWTNARLRGSIAKS